MTEMENQFGLHSEQSKNKYNYLLFPMLWIKQFGEQSYWAIFLVYSHHNLVGKNLSLPNG